MSLPPLFREFRDNWASRTASSANQQSCKGTTVCNSGYTYNSSSQKCEKFDERRVWTAGEVDISLASCASLNYKTRCDEMTNLIEQSDKSCKWNSGERRQDWQGAFGRGQLCDTTTIDTNMWKESAYKSYEDRVNANSNGGNCGTGYTKLDYRPIVPSLTTNYYKCIENRPSDIEYNPNDGSLIYKCPTGSSRLSDGRCKYEQNPNFD
jgi:hypothetical protein